MKSATSSPRKRLRGGRAGTAEHSTKLVCWRRGVHTHLSHLSLLFLQGSQLIAFLARFGGGRGSVPAPSMESREPFAAGERPRTCFRRGVEVVEAGALVGAGWVQLRG